MPTWLVVVLSIAGGLTAAATIWRVLTTVAELVTLQAKALPLLRTLVKVFGDVPTPFDVLGEIVAEFRTDSGSSLRDVVNRLDLAATDNRSAAEVLKVQTETARLLAGQDRAQLQQLLLLLDRLTIKVEGEAGRVRDNLVVAQSAVDDVARDLSESHARADAIAGGAPGEASDAANRNPV